MKKLALNVESLLVESFDTTATRRNDQTGTVRGHSFEEWDNQIRLNDETGYTFCGSCYCNTQYSCPTRERTACGTCAQVCIRW